MNKLTSILLAFILLCHASCQRDEVNDHYPDCLQSSIDHVMSQPPRTPMSKIIKHK